MRQDRQTRIELLKTASLRKSELAEQRATAAIDALARKGERIDFRSVARAAPVSIDFLYRHPALRAKIERLRVTVQPTTNASPPLGATSGAAGVLLARLDQERRANKTLRDENQRLLGELIALRRRLPENDPHGNPAIQPTM